jgi:hypothetical protein
MGKVSVDGYTVCVTKTLAFALEMISLSFLAGDETPEFLLWVDSVCINQNDIRERGEQVLLMRKIYKNAQFVTGG